MYFAEQFLYTYIYISFNDISWFINTSVFIDAISMPRIIFQLNQIPLHTVFVYTRSLNTI